MEDGDRKGSLKYLALVWAKKSDICVTEGCGSFESFQLNVVSTQVCVYSY